MVPRTSATWPRWHLVHDAWCRAQVPDVQILRFELGKHHPHLPWFDLEQKDQIGIGDNPVLNTAYHLSEHISKAPDELKAAYKLYAFCREHEISAFRQYVLAPVFQKYGEQLYGWWHSNARRVLPWYEDINSFDYSDPDQRGWRQIVCGAATAWTQIARRWAVIRIPQWMDRGSDEYKAYERHVNALSDERERLEYERLKNKFERSQ